MDCTTISSKKFSMAGRGVGRPVAEKRISNEKIIIGSVVLCCLSLEYDTVPVVYLERYGRETGKSETK